MGGFEGPSRPQAVFYPEEPPSSPKLCSLESALIWKQVLEM